MRAHNDGLRLAFSWLTVVPVRGPSNVDRSAARRALSAAPVVGVVLGSVMAGAMWVLLALDLDPVLAGLITLGTHAMLTRGMHIDGLADTVDGLGCYGPPERAREIMKSGTVGPFGVAAIVLLLGIQAAALGSLGSSHVFVSIVVAVTTGRVAVVFACLEGVPAASSTGFGALVASTQSRWIAASWSLALILVSVWAVPNAPFAGPAAVIVALAAAALLVRHCVRRFGGLSGDVLGAVIEVSTAISLVGCVIAA